MTVSTDEYYKIYNCDPFGEFYSSNGARATTNGGEYSSNLLQNHQYQNQLHPTSFFKMLFSTSLTIIVPKNPTPTGDRLLKLYNLKQNLKICELLFPSRIVDVKLNRKRLCIIVESGHIYIYDLSCVRLVKVLEIEPPMRSNHSHSQSQAHRPSDPMSLPSPSSSTSASSYSFVGDLSADDKSYLVLPLSVTKALTDLFNKDRKQSNPGSSSPSTPHLAPVDDNLSQIIEFTHKSKNLDLQPSQLTTVEDLNKHSNGWVLVYDTIHLRPKLIYKAHDSSIAKISISNDASKIATASSKGTIIRTCTLTTGTSEDDDEEDVIMDESLKRLRISHFTNLRRGHNLTKVTCLSFSLDNNVLGCASDSGTIHFFKLDEPDSLLDPSLDDDSLTEGMAKSSDDLNDNLASLLIEEQQKLQQEQQQQQQYQQQQSQQLQQDSSQNMDQAVLHLYFHNLKNMSLLNNTYTKSIVKKLPYKGYLENLWEPPRRSFAYVKIPEPEGSRVEIGFVNSMQVVLASYSTGEFYHYQLPNRERAREEAIIVSEYKLT